MDSKLKGADRAGWFGDAAGAGTECFVRGTMPSRTRRTGVDCRADSRTYREKISQPKYKTAILGGAKTFDGTEADRGYVVNEQTGEMIPMGMIGAMSQTTNQKFRQPARRKIGQTYKTPQRPDDLARGNGWEKAA